MTTLDWLTAIGAALPGLAALVVALWKLKSSKAESKKADAETEKTHINGQSVVITNLCTEVERLSRRVDQLEEDYALLQQKYDHVLDWAIPRGYEPPHW